MSDEHHQGLSSAERLSDPHKRKRTPSHYATQIADFKNVTLPPSRITLQLHAETRLPGRVRAARVLLRVEKTSREGGWPAFCPQAKSIHSR